MRVTLNWLKEFVEIEAPAASVAEMLTMAGLEVESIDQVGAALDGVVAVRIKGVEPHPNAQRLSLCRVWDGKREYIVVCGAPNLRVGDMVPLALPGALLPNGVAIKETVIRGQMSAGMLLAEDEMGLSDDHSGIMILPASAREGAMVSEVLNLSDWVFEISITPNRPDCASVIGIAREIAAVNGRRVRKPQVSFEEEEIRVESLTSVSILDPAACRRYCAGIVRNTSPISSPFWLRHRLQLAGVRAINSIVDITNYVMLETGQPLHAFDYDLLVGRRIEVKRASQGESFTTLDGKNHVLTGEHLMICDGARSVALAGIMGGVNSEISNNTRNVLLESAYFDPLTIRRGAKALGVSTEASYRFERGIDLANVDWALKRAMALIQQISGGSIPNGIIDNYPSPYRAVRIGLRVDKANRYLGTSLGRDRMADILRGLEMDVKEKGDDELEVIPPSFRVDIHREVDLTEEIARIYGYENIGTTIPPVRSMKVVNKEPFTALKERTDSLLSSIGFNEVITYSFVPDQYPDYLAVPAESDLRAFVRVLNPLTSEHAVMRTSLFPGLMGAVKNNLAFDEKDLRLYEFGKVFIASGKGRLPEERCRLAGVITGLFEKKTWYRQERECDFYDIKGVVESLAAGLGVTPISFVKGASDPAYEPSVSVTLVRDGIELGHAGKAGLKLLKAYDLESHPLYLFDLDMERLLTFSEKSPRFVPISKFPAVYRDLSIIVDKKVDSETISGIIRQEGGGLVESVRLFDLYEGKQMQRHEKALAYKICYRSQSGTLEGAQVNRIFEATIKRITTDTGGRLREA